MVKIFKKGDAYEPRKHDWFIWHCDRRIRWAFAWSETCDDACGYVDEQVLDLLNAGLIEIHRKVPDEPYVQDFKVRASENYLWVAGTIQVPNDRFADGDRVKVTIEKVSI